MKKFADRRRREEVQYKPSDLVLLSTRYLRMKNYPAKLQRRFVGPFKVIEQISRVAYRLELPAEWRAHPVFHSSLLKLWQESHWSCPVDAPAPEFEVEGTPYYTVERILHWRKIRRGRRNERKFLVIWTGYSIDEAEWIPERNFFDKAGLNELLGQNKPMEDLGAGSR